METPGAIGVAPASMVIAGVRVPNAPHPTAKVIVVTNGEPSKNVRKLIDILKDIDLLQ
jgi:hypothetical protein